MKPRRMLVVDDEPGIRRSLSGVLEDEGYAVDAVESGEACLEALPGGGLRAGAAGHLAAGHGRHGSAGAHPGDPVRGAARGGDDFRPRLIEAAVKATKLGAFDFLEKPLSIEKVTVVVKNALDHRSLALENSRLKADTGSRWRIIGETACP